MKPLAGSKASRELSRGIIYQYKYIFDLIESNWAVHIINTSLLMVRPERELQGLEKFTGFLLPIEEIKLGILDADEKYFA
jgi:hypothetical protein